MTALIVGDIQRGITSAFPFARQVVPPLTDLLPHARAAGILVVFVHIAFRVNRSDLPADNPLFSSFFMDKTFPGRGHDVVSCVDWLTR